MEFVTVSRTSSNNIELGSSEEFVGSIDQGTTSSRFLIFNKDGKVVASHQQEFTQIYPQPG
jgi:glycerol kinase